MAKKITNGVVVVGLGRFGKSLALELMHERIKVLGVDADPKVVQSLAGRLTHVVEADSTNEEAMRQLAVGEFDVAVIGIGNLEASILSASVAVSLGVPAVWAKAVSTSHALILSQIGVDHVARPEHDMGRRVAHLLRGGMIEYLEFDEDNAFVKTTVPRALHRRTLGGYGVRSTYGVTVVGVKPKAGQFTYATADTLVHEGDEIMVAGPKAAVEAFARLE